MAYFNTSAPFRDQRTQPYASLAVLAKAFELCSSGAPRLVARITKDIGK